MQLLKHLLLFFGAFLLASLLMLYIPFFGVVAEVIEEEQDHITEELELILEESKHRNIALLS